MQACVREFTEASQLADYIRDDSHGLTREYTNGSFDLSVSYVPSDLLLSREMQSYRDNNELLENKARYDSILYFTLRISQNNKKIEHNYVRDPDALSKIVSYLSEGIAADVYILSDADTLKPMGVMYSGTVGITPATDLMLAFPRNDLTKSASQLSLYFNDSVIGCGRSVFEFKTKDIIKVPSLKLRQL